MDTGIYDYLRKMLCIQPLNWMEKSSYRMAPSIFQNHVDKIMESFQDRFYIFVYLDDFLVAANSYDECQRFTNSLLAHLRQIDLTINENKCQILPELSIEYLGHKISKDIVEPTNSYIEAMEFMPLDDKTDLRRLLGKLSFSRRQFHPCHLLRNMMFCQARKIITIEPKYVLLRHPHSHSVNHRRLYKLLRIRRHYLSHWLSLKNQKKKYRLCHPLSHPILVACHLRQLRINRCLK